MTADISRKQCIIKITLPDSVLILGPGLVTLDSHFLPHRGTMSRFQPHFEASDRRRTPGGLLRHAPPAATASGSSQLDGKKVFCEPRMN